MEPFVPVTEKTERSAAPKLHVNAASRSSLNRIVAHTVSPSDDKCVIGNGAPCCSSTEKACPLRKQPARAPVPCTTTRDRQGSRFNIALPLSMSTGTEICSCAMSQLPLTFRKHVVHRSQESVLWPFFN